MPIRLPMNDLIVHRRFEDFFFSTVCFASACKLGAKSGHMGTELREVVFSGRHPWQSTTSRRQTFHIPHASTVPLNSGPLGGGFLLARVKATVHLTKFGVSTREEFLKRYRDEIPLALSVAQVEAKAVFKSLTGMASEATGAGAEARLEA